MARVTCTGHTAQSGCVLWEIPSIREARRVLEGRPAVLFAGEFVGHVDSHGRIAVPDALLEALSGGAIVARGFERCISVYSTDGWQRLADEIRELPATDEQTRRLSRFIFASADEQQIDRQGRLDLSAPVRRYAGIDRDVVVVGAGNLIEIWDSGAWAVELASLESQTTGVGHSGNPAGDERAAA